MDGSLPPPARRAEFLARAATPAPARSWNATAPASERGQGYGPSVSRKAPAMAPYPSPLAWMFGPTGGAAHIHVHWHTTRTLWGMPAPGTRVKSDEKNVPATSATGTLKPP